MKSKVLLIIPAYNEELNIENVVEGLKNSYPQYDYVIINDGSKDKTSLVCHRNKYNVVDLVINIGLTGAFRTGMKYAYQHGYDYAMQYDGDGQHNPEYIEQMIEVAEQEKAEVVIGSRYVKEKMPWDARMIGARIIKTCIFLTSRKIIQDPTSGMRLYGKKVMESFVKNSSYAPEPDTLAFMARCGVKISECQVYMNERIAGESYFNISSSIKYMARMCSEILIVQWFRKKV